LKDNNLSDEDRRSMQIPTGVSFEVEPDAESLADIRMLVRHRTWLVEVSWRREHGLIVRPIEGYTSAPLAQLPLETSEKERMLHPSESEA